MKYKKMWKKLKKELKKKYKGTNNPVYEYMMGCIIHIEMEVKE